MVYVGVVVIVVFVPKGCVYLLITSKGWAQTSEHLSFASNLRFLAFIPFSCVSKFFYTSEEFLSVVAFSCCSFVAYPIFS